MNINHEMAMETGYVRRKSLLGRVLTAIYRFTLRTCDRVVVMDHWMKSRVEREGIVGSQNIVIVPLWPITPDESDEVAAAQCEPVQG
jgi:hypothetical protein